MIASEKSADPPIRPLLVWDGDCGFCNRCVICWRRFTKHQLDDRPYQSGSLPPSSLTPISFAQRVYLFDPDGSIYSGAAAVYRSLESTPLGFLDGWYRRSSIFATLSEKTYTFVAGHRSLFSKLFPK